MATFSLTLIPYSIDLTEAEKAFKLVVESKVQEDWG